jgi:competence protein ComFC
MFIVLKLFIRDVLISLIEIVFPEFCVGCGKFNTLLCSRCYQTIEFVQFKINSHKNDNKLDSIICCCYYQSVAKKLVHELKYTGVINVGKTIAHIIYYNSNLPEFDLITFVPIHNKKLKLRGFNQTKIIAKELGKITNTPVASLLIKTKNTKSQMSLDNKSNREKSILNSIKINPKIFQNDKIKFKSILIIDDVYTSGTTLRYCAKILKDFGFKNIHGACFLYKN